MCVCSLLKEKHFLVNFIALTHHHPPIYQLPFSLCHGDYEDDHFCFLLSAGELEKQQGAKTHSVKNNGTQLELRGKQGSPSGVCVCVCILLLIESHWRDTNCAVNLFTCCCFYELDHIFKNQALPVAFNIKNTV